MLIFIKKVKKDKQLYINFSTANKKILLYVQSKKNPKPNTPVSNNMKNIHNTIYKTKTGSGFSGKTRFYQNSI